MRGGFEISLSDSQAPNQKKRGEEGREICGIRVTMFACKHQDAAAAAAAAAAAEDDDDEAPDSIDEATTALPG